MSSQIDLNALRAHVHKVEREREQSGASATDQATGVFVDRDANIQLGAASGGRDLSRVPVEKFAAFDLATNRHVAVTKLPPNTVEISGPAAGPTGVGWAFEVSTEFFDRFKIIITYDGQYYQAHVLQPEIEVVYRDPHGYHLFSDARICFGNNYGGGMPTLESAYAKAVVWANGFSVAKRGHKFPWNWDQ